jgi:hypothetical protein
MLNKEVSSGSLAQRSLLAFGGRPFPQKLALVTDAWKPQTNGVVNTLVKLIRSMEARGTEVLVVSPDAFRTVPLPSYPEIRIAYDPWRAVPRIRSFDPDAIHVATEGRWDSGPSAGCAAGACSSPPAATRVTPST